MVYYLYIKTHRRTSLKYLGKTSQDPYRYHGSGTVWVQHLKKHGYDIDTEIIFATESKEELRQRGIYYSDLWNVEHSDEWANLKREEGDGGRCIWDGMVEHLHSIASSGGKAKAKLNLPAWNKGISTPRSKDGIQKQKETIKGYVWWNNGVNEKKAKECPEGWVRGRLPLTKEWKEKLGKKGNQYAKLPWYTNGADSIKIRPGQNIPEGFKPGRTLIKRS